ncbi:MAG: hypothetical protein WCN88_05220, partial [Candidatus Falkowbacteria bacterium]
IKKSPPSKNRKTVFTGTGLLSFSLCLAVPPGFFAINYRRALHFSFRFALRRIISRLSLVGLAIS